MRILDCAQAQHVCGLSKIYTLILSVEWQTIKMDMANLRYETGYVRRIINQCKCYVNNIAERHEP